MPRGRPRKLQGEEQGVVTAQTGEIVTETIVADEPVRSEEVKEQTKKVPQFLPYTGKDSLPPAVIDKHGRVKKAGESRYFLSGNSNAGYKLLRVYRNGKGIGRSLVRVLKVGGRTAAVNKVRYNKDKAFLEQLRKAGIPGY